MSSELAPVVVVQDPRTALDQKNKDVPELAVYKSGLLYTPYNTNFLSYSTSSCSITIQSSGIKMFISRDIRAKFKFQFTINDPSPDAKFTPMYSAPTAFPLNSALQTLSLSINGANTTQNNAQILAALLRYNNHREWREAGQSTTPAMPDYFQEFKDQFGNVGGVQGTGGFLYSPFAPSGSTIEPSRAGFGEGGSIFKNVSPDGKVLTLEIVEPLFISPLTTNRNAPAFSNVSYLQFQMTFMPNIAQFMLAQINENNPNAFNVNSVSVSIIEPPSLLYSMITPTQTQMSEIPATLTFPYTRYLVQETVNLNMTAGQVLQNVQAQPIKLVSIPNYLYVYCTPVNYNNRLMTDSQSYCQISNVQILYNNSSSLLANATIQELYAMSKDNGYIWDFTSFAYRNGTVLRISFSNDIMQNEFLSPGCNAQTTLNVSCTIKNISGRTVNAVLTTIIEMDGICNITPNLSQFTQSTLTSDDVRRAEAQPSQYHLLDSPSLENKNEPAGSGRKHLISRKAHKRFTGDGGAVMAGAPMAGAEMGGSAVLTARSLRAGAMPKFMSRN